MCQKCVTVAKSSAQGPGPGSRMWVHKLWKNRPVSQIRCDPIRCNSENVSKVCNCRRIQRPGSQPRIRKSMKSMCKCCKIQVPGARFLVQNVSKTWPASQIQGPWSGNTALRENEPCADRNQIGPQSEKNRASIGGRAPVTPC